MIDLRLGDCLELMREMPDASVDLVFTSPPFKEEDVDGDYWQLFSQWFAEMNRIASKVLVVIHSATKINTLIHDYPPKRVMIWSKGFSQYSYRFNLILVYQKTKEYNVNRRIWADCFAVPSMTGWQKQKVHKYQDPENLYDALFKMFKECKTVLDPFMGSGTAGVVSVKLDRDFTGFEKDADVFAIAQKRIADVQKQPALAMA